MSFLRTWFGPTAVHRRGTACLVACATAWLAAADAWPHVVLANGRIFCRDRSGTLVCLELMGAAAPGADDALRR